MRIGTLTRWVVAPAIAAALVLGGASTALAADPVDPDNDTTLVSQTDESDKDQEVVSTTEAPAPAVESSESTETSTAPADQPVAKQVPQTTEAPAPPADTLKPTAAAKTASTNGAYKSVDFKLTDNVGVVAWKANNGPKRSVSPSKWSDADGIAVGKNGGVEGNNTIYVYDAAGNVGETPFVLDTTGPSISVKDGENFTVGDKGRNIFSVVSVKLNDPRKVTAVIVNGQKQPLSPNVWSDRNGLKPGAFNAKEGANTLVAVDALGNQSAPFEFTLDTGKPTATLKDSSKRNPAGELIVADVKLYDGVLVASYRVNDGPVRNVTPNKWSDTNDIAIDKNGGKQGKNVVTVRDVAGNIGTLEFTLVAADTAAPTATNTTQVYEAKQNGRIAVTVTFSEPVNSPGQGWYAVGGSNDTKWTKVYYSSKEYTIEFTDKAGNKGTHTFSVDATAPTVVGEPKQEYDPKNGQNRTKVTLTFSEPVNPASLPQGWYGSGVAFSKVYFGEKKSETVNFTDLVGNPGSTTFDVKDLKPAPEKPKPIAWGWSWNNHFGGGWLNNLLNNIFGGWRW